VNSKKVLVKLFTLLKGRAVHPPAWGALLSRGRRVRTLARVQAGRCCRSRPESKAVDEGDQKKPGGLGEVIKRKREGSERKGQMLVWIVMNLFIGSYLISKRDSFVEKDLGSRQKSEEWERGKKRNGHYTKVGQQKSLKLL